MLVAAVRNANVVAVRTNGGRAFLAARHAVTVSASGAIDNSAPIYKPAYIEPRVNRWDLACHGIAVEW